MEGNSRFKINWASVLAGSQFTVFALFYFILRAIFQIQAPGGLIFFGGTIYTRVAVYCSLASLVKS